MIPKKAFDKIQQSIARAIWGSRPMWRAEWLLIGLICEPYRIDPFVASA